MSKDTSIAWTDSSLNIEMGCDGCELWNRKSGVKICYSGTLTDRYGGRKGYPEEFEIPVIFPERLDPALKWGDLTGKDRPEKPWLNGMPRLIFLNDMGDTFTESLDIDWLAPYLPRMAASPHHWLLLTKRPSRMADFSTRYPLPSNVWPGTSITSSKTLRRLDLLREVKGGGPRWCSAEPILAPFDITPWVDGTQMKLDWLILGGQSGAGCPEFELGWLLDPLWRATQAGVPTFCKQLGSNPGFHVDDKSTSNLVFDRLRLKDPKGEDWSEWDENLRVRQMPKLEVTSCL